MQMLEIAIQIRRFSVEILFWLRNTRNINVTTIINGEFLAQQSTSLNWINLANTWMRSMLKSGSTNLAIYQLKKEALLMTKSFFSIILISETRNKPFPIGAIGASTSTNLGKVSLWQTLNLSISLSNTIFYRDVQKVEIRSGYSDDTTLVRV